MTPRNPPGLQPTAAKQLPFIGFRPSSVPAPLPRYSLEPVAVPVVEAFPEPPPGETSPGADAESTPVPAAPPPVPRTSGRFSENGTPALFTPWSLDTQHNPSSARDQSGKSSAIPASRQSTRTTPMGRSKSELMGHYNHYGHPPRTAPASVGRSPRTLAAMAAGLPRISVTADANGVKLAEVLAHQAVNLLPTSTHGMRAAATPAGGWKTWAGPQLHFEPPPLRAQSPQRLMVPTTPSIFAPSSPQPLHPSSLTQHSMPAPASGIGRPLVRSAPQSRNFGGPMDRDIHKPQTDDVLNLWKGKRLNKAEIRLEAKLHNLRNNPTARMQLEDTVRRYIDDRTAAAVVLAVSLAAKAELKEARKEAAREDRITTAHTGKVRMTGTNVSGPSSGLSGELSGRSSPSPSSPSGRSSPAPRSRRPTAMGGMGGMGGMNMRGGRSSPGSSPERNPSSPGAAAALARSRLPAQDSFEAELAAFGGGVVEPAGRMSEAGGVLAPPAPKRIFQVTLSEWKGRRKLLTEAQVKREVAAAIRLQKMWRGRRERIIFKAKRRAAITIQRVAKPRYQPEAIEARRRYRAHMVLTFLQTDCASTGIGNLKALRQAFLRSKRAENKLELAYTMRVARLARQWAEVERLMLGAARRRTRSSPSPVLDMGQEHTSPARGQQNKKDKQAKLLQESLEARKKGILPGQAMEDADCRNLTANAAVEGCHATDRLVGDTLTPVPQEVKGAVIASYLDAKQHAFYALMGRHWQALAHHRRDNKMAEMMAAARSVVTNHASDKTASDIPAKPAMPKMRVMCTHGELKCLMQQGVAETIIFHAYVLKANLNEYEQQLHADAARQHTPVDLAAIVKLKKKHHRAGAPLVSSVANLLATAVPGAAPLAPPGPNQAAVDELSFDGPTSGAFAAVTGSGHQLTQAERTLARTLKQQWWKDATMRAGPCLRRRWQLLKVDLVECLHSRVFQTSEQIASILLDHRNSNNITPQPQ